MPDRAAQARVGCGNSATGHRRQARQTAGFSKPRRPRARGAAASASRQSRTRDAPGQVLTTRAVLFDREQPHRKMPLLARQPELGPVLGPGLVAAGDFHGIEFSGRSLQQLATADLVFVSGLPTAVENAELHRLRFARHQREGKKKGQAILCIGRHRLRAPLALVLHGHRLRLPVEPGTCSAAAGALMGKLQGAQDVVADAAAARALRRSEERVKALALPRLGELVAAASLLEPLDDISEIATVAGQVVLDLDLSRQCRLLRSRSSTTCPATVAISLMSSSGSSKAAAATSSPRRGRARAFTRSSERRSARAAAASATTSCAPWSLPMSAPAAALHVPGSTGRRRR